MMQPQPGDFWWGAITGPRAFVKAVAENVIDGRMTALVAPADVPWRHAMRGAVQEALREASPLDDPYIYTVDAADECPAADGIGDFLLERLASAEVANGYRPKAGHTIQKYMVANGVLANKLIWVKGIPGDAVGRWLDFGQGFEKPSLKTGLLLAEICSPLPHGSWGKFHEVEFSRFVNRHDVQLFCAFWAATGGHGVSQDWSDYIAVAAASLCGLDAEMAMSLITEGNWLERDPRDMLAELTGARDLKDEWDQRLWTAQIQVLFPLIEMERARIIKIMREPLAEILKERTVVEFGRETTEPEELELGTLVYLMAVTKADGLRALYVPDESLRDRIFALRECRNTLAHRRGCCSPQQVGFILGLSGQGE